MTARLINPVRLLLIAGFVVSTVACDSAERRAARVIHNQPQPTLVIAAGSKILMNGAAVPIFGFDDCPRQDRALEPLFGPAPLDGHRDCIVLSDDRAVVAVGLALPTGSVREQWTIVRGHGTADKPARRVSLKRADGSLVVPADGKETS